MYDLYGLTRAHGLHGKRGNGDMSDDSFPDLYRNISTNRRALWLGGGFFL
jgi:hypothetical protein